MSVQAASILVRSLSFADSLPHLWRNDFLGWHLGMPLRLYVSRARVARMPGLPVATANGPLLCLWHNRSTTRAMRLTPRCLDILKLLKAARWLTTSQLHRRFFGPSTVDAARKRLRKLAEADYLVQVQPNRMEESLFRLGSEGKRHLERMSDERIVLDRQPPKQLEHFLGMNDLRIAAELDLPLSYFFAYWELASIGWRQPVIPDAVFQADSRTFAVEFDRGHENLKFFLRTKLNYYFRGFDGFPVERLLIVTDRQVRLESLAKLIGANRAKVLLTRRDLIQQRGFSAPVFFETSLGGGQKLL